MTLKRGIVIGCCLVFVFAVGCLLCYLQSAEHIIDFPRADITRAYIVDGDNGDIMELKKRDIDVIYQGIKDTSVKSVKKEETSGWRYQVCFERGGHTDVIEMISSKLWEVSGKWYEVSGDTGDKVIEDISKIQF